MQRLWDFMGSEEAKQHYIAFVNGEIEMPSDEEIAKIINSL